MLALATKDGKFAYTANAGSGTLSGFSVSSGGALRPARRERRHGQLRRGRPDPLDGTVGAQR